MSHEIYYTSAPEGVKRGTSGFCTVATSANIPRALWDRLETLSAYRHQFGIGGEGQGAGAGDRRLNPVSYAHWLLNIGAGSGTAYHVLSRIADSGVDHTQRTNAFAHHLVLDPTELAPGGPAWMLATPGVMATHWNGRVGSIERAVPLPRGGDAHGGVCRAWEQLTGDPGWGGALADVFMKTPARPVCILFAPGQEMLPLMLETLELLPPAARWNVTFNTYFTSMPTSATCAWRCCLAGTPAATVGLRYAGGGGIIIDLTDPSRLPAIAEGPYVQAARSGVMPAASTATLAEKANAARPAREKSTGPAPKPAKSPAPPAAPVRSLIDDDDEDRAFAEDSDDSIDLLPEPTVAPSVATQDTPAGKNAPFDTGNMPPARRRIHPGGLRTRIVPTAPAGELGMEASAAAARRRRQILILFGAAMVAILLGLVLVMIASRNAAPPDVLIPPNPGKTAAGLRIPPGPPLPAGMPKPVATPAPVRDGKAAKAAAETNPSTIASTAPSTPPPPAPKRAPSNAAPVQIVSRYPATIQITDRLQRPASGMGIADFRQTVVLPEAQVDPALDVRTIALHLPKAKDTSPDGRSISFSADFDGSLVATSVRSENRPGAILSWRNSAGQTSEVVAIACNRRPASLEFAWKTGLLVKSPEIVTLAYWVLQCSTIRTTVARGTGQQIALHPYTPPIMPLTSPGAMLSWPNDLPKDTTVAPPPANSLPAGWQATWYTDWEEKDAALRTAANASQVIKFRKPTSTAGIDAWFLVKFSPAFAKVENSFAPRLAEVQAELQQYESDLKAAKDDLEEMRKEIGGGPLPQTSERVRNAEAKRDKASRLIEAYRSAVASYQQIQGFDIGITLPDGLRLTTMQFRKTDK